MPAPIPSRWTVYKPIGEKIEGTRFIPFKVPLKQQVSKNVESEVRLDDKILLQTIPNLGLIIDLTNTNRFYDPKVFQKEGIKHKKLMIQGHITPRKGLVDKFIVIVKKFMKANKDNDKLIGVHCTHGVNRTGYMICNFMISQMTIAPSEAMSRFATARGHKIERNNYIVALQKLQESCVLNSSAERKVEPENWKERKDGDVQRDERTQNKQDRTKISETSHTSHNQCRASKTLPNCRSPHNSSLNDHIIERPDNTVQPAVLQLTAPNPTLYTPPQLRLDYYNSRPVGQRSRFHERYTYIRKTNDKYVQILKK